MEIVFVRFGKIPSNEKSKNFLTGQLEKGVSVYEAIKREGIYSILLPSLKGSACVTLSGLLYKRMFEVAGGVVGYGRDGEPLLTDCVILSEIRHTQKERDSEGWG